MSIPAITGPINLPKFDIVRSIPIPKDTLELFSISPIKDLLDGNSNAQPSPERNDKDNKCQTSIKFEIIKINAVNEEIINIIVEKFIKKRLSNLSAYFPIIDPTANSGATLNPEFNATSRALSLKLKIT